MAKLIKLKCPDCNAPLEIDLNRPIKYCSYCGTPIYFDDGVKRIEIKSEQHIKNEHITRDETKIQITESVSEIILGIAATIILLVIYVLMYLSH